MLVRRTDVRLTPLLDLHMNFIVFENFTNTVHLIFNF